MVPHVGKLSRTVRAAVVCALLAVPAAGCGAIASGDLDAHVGADPLARTVSNACSQAALGALGSVATRVYREGVSSSRTASALSMIEHSIPLREAVERNDPRAARTASQALIATGHMTNLELIHGGAAAEGGGRVLADAGTPNALAPLRGSILDAAGVPIASFVASVWADDGFVDETNGITEGVAALREHGRSITGSFALPAGMLPAQGALTIRGIDYRYTSFPADVYPAGRLRVYLLRSISSIAPLCGRTPTDTVVNTITRVAKLIYTGEIGASALTQVRRVQHNRPLLRAVAQREPEATRLAIDNLLNEHIVRIRVSIAGQLLSDVGGPYVLAPVRAPLRVQGKTIGNVVLSIQDDLGYLLLAQRLAGCRVVMHRGSQVVMSSFRLTPTDIPTEGPFRYQGQSYRVLTLHAEAFPSGPLLISVLIPIPYS
jgi:DNA-binding GntR family transcriptional regulator